MSRRRACAPSKARWKTCLVVFDGAGTIHGKLERALFAVLPDGVTGSEVRAAIGVRRRNSRRINGFS